MDFNKIKAFAMDVDGVFTDGGILCDLQGELYRTFDAKDGFAIRMAEMNGYPVAIITGGRSESIRQRFLTSSVPADDVFLGSRDKVADFKRFCDRYGLRQDEVLFIGDDVPDMPVLSVCGCAVCPSDAVPEVKSICDWVSDFPGGKCCIRDLVERILKAQGKWKFNIDAYVNQY